jgi:Predicted permeases
MSDILPKKHRIILSEIWKPLAAVTMWGFSFIATKYVLRNITPLTLIFLRQVIGSLFLFALALKTKKNFNITRNNFKGIIILSIIATLHLAIQVTGLQYTSALNTGWIIGITPVFMAILGLLLFKEKITTPQITGIIIAFAGLLVLISKGNIASIDLISNKGDFLILASAFTWGVYSIANKKVSINFSPMLTIMFLFILMSIYIAPFILNIKNINAVLNLTLTAWAAVLFLGIFCSGIAYVLWAQALSEMTSSKVGVFLYFEPFVTFIGAWFLLGEHFTVITVLGGIGIICGVVLVNRK